MNYLCSCSGFVIQLPVLDNINYYRFITTCHVHTTVIRVHFYLSQTNVYKVNCDRLSLADERYIYTYNIKHVYIITVGLSE